MDNIGYAPADIGLDELEKLLEDELDLWELDIILFNGLFPKGTVEDPDC